MPGRPPERHSASNRSHAPSSRRACSNGSPAAGPRGREAVPPPFAPLGLPPPARIIQGQSVTVALGLVGHMDLIGLFVEPLVKLTFKRHGIRRIDVVETHPTRTVCVVRGGGQRSTPAAQHFIECIQRASAAAMGV